MKFFDILRRDCIWIILILLLIIVAVLALLLTGIKGAGAILSCAATLTSIVLSIVTIIYSIIQGAAATRTSQSTDLAIAEIKQKVQEITQKESSMRQCMRDFQLISSSGCSSCSTNSESKHCEASKIKAAFDAYIDEDIQE